MPLTEWYNGVVENGQSVGRVLPTMALTVLDPTHRDAYRGDSCYGQVALEIARRAEAGDLTTDHAIGIYGHGKMVFHTVLSEGDAIILDTLYSAGRKLDEPYRHNDIHSDLTLLARVPMQDFIERHVNKINIPESAPPQPAPRT